MLYNHVKAHQENLSYHGLPGSLMKHVAYLNPMIPINMQDESECSCTETCNYNYF